MTTAATTRSTLLHEHDIPAPPYITLLGDEQKMMNVRDARAALARMPALPDDWLELSNLASAHYVLGDVARAAELSALVLSKNRNVSTLMNAAVILETYGRFAEALPLAAEANSLDPGDPYAGVLYSAALLRFGRWLEAWPDYVRYCANFSWLHPVLHEWTGLSESLVNKRLLVLDEGGYGDNIFFFRWMPLLKQLGAHVTLKCPTQFGPLVRDYSFIDRVIGGGAEGAPVEIIPREYDLFTSILDLGLHFGVSCHEYRWTGPYMFADAHKAQKQRQALRGDALTIGLCWKSGENVSPRKHRSLTPEQTERIIRTSPPAGCNWVSLVYDELPPLSTPGVCVQVPAINDWSDTAAVLAALDLVVTTDTGVAHLAGAMGVPVWVMLPGISAWQFLLGSERHPLYPTMRMFRNRGEGIDNAVDSLCDVLRRGIR
jgi:tetratricopeptide (TPR) repeat protein